MKPNTILQRMVVMLITLMCALGANAQEAYAVLSDDGETLTFYYDTNKSSYENPMNLNTGSQNPRWMDIANITTVVFDDSFKDAQPTSTYRWFYKQTNLETIKGISNLNTSEVTKMGYMFYKCSSLTSLDVSCFNTGKVEDMSYMFDGCSSLTSLDVSKFNTANVTTMYSMFSGCNSLTSLDVSSFDTSNVTVMAYMFSGCSSLTSLDVSKFDTSNVTDIYGMFISCSSLTSLDVSAFDTDNFTNMDYMFEGCKSLTSLDVSSFNTSNVTTMCFMFRYCSSLTSLDVSNFNTANVTIMYGMFDGCSSLTSLDLISFNTGKVTKMKEMFYGCSSLVTIYAGNGWTTDAVTDDTNMFKKCTQLKGGAGTTYNKDYVNKLYARIDGGTSTPGYLTSAGNLKHHLYVAGTQVTGLNRHNIPITSGTASYIPSTKTLTLNNATITVTGSDNCIMNDNPYVHDGGIVGLTIKVVGTCRLNADDYAITLNQNTTISGTGSLLVTGGEGGIYLGNELTSLTCKVKRLNVTSSKNALEAYPYTDNSLKIDGSNVECVTNTPASFKPITGFRKLTFTNVRFGDPGGEWKYNDTSKFSYSYNSTNKGRVLFDNTEYRGKVVIEPSTDPMKYRLWVAGTRVTSANKNNISISSGTAMFDPDTHTLTLNNAKIVADRYDDGISNGYIDTNIEGMPDFKIVCSGNNIIEPELGAGLALNGNTTISGGKLVINADINGIDLGELKKLTFQNADVYTEASYPIRCRYNSVVNVNHSRLEADPGSSQNSPVYGPIAFNMLYCEYADPGNGINPEQLFYNDDEQILEMYYGQYPYDGTLLIVPTEISITTGIENGQRDAVKVQSDAWFTIDGQKLSGKPTKKGVYIHNGMAVVL